MRITATNLAKFFFSVTKLNFHLKPNDQKSIWLKKKKTCIVHYINNFKFFFFQPNNRITFIPFPFFYILYQPNTTLFLQLDYGKYPSWWRVNLYESQGKDAFHALVIRFLKQIWVVSFHEKEKLLSIGYHLKKPTLKIHPLPFSSYEENNTKTNRSL